MHITPFECSFNGATVSFDNGMLRVSTGCVTRRWIMTPCGPATVLFKNDSGNAMINSLENAVPDYEIFTVTDASNPASLTAADAEIVTSNTFTTPHIRVRCEFTVPSQHVIVRYAVDVYPGAPGLRTQLSLKAMKGSIDRVTGMLPNWLLESWSERLPLACGECTRIPVGYYNDTQHRYHADLSVLKEEQYAGPVEGCEIHDWANLIALEKGDGSGLILLKESHKCVNQRGIDTGHFKVYTNALVSTGLGLKSHYRDGPEHCTEEDFREAWATWSLLYTGGSLGRQKAVKIFDSLRFPFNYKRDGIITNNTWGSRGRVAATEESVLVELERAAKLGIDCIQIDDGWQTDEWMPDLERWPLGWERVKSRAQELGIKLGIWFAWQAPLEAMGQNVRKGGFTQIKLDYFKAMTRKDLDAFYTKARFLSELHPEIQINADLTEEVPRFGYYYGRDVCSLFPQNIELCQPDKGNMGPRHIIYTPWLTLRQTWHYAHYMNLNQLQTSTQNIEMIDPNWSDAPQHSHDYCFAITMMGLPLLFLETKFYSEEAIQKLKPAISLYRTHRQEILKGIVHPIGDEPSNASVTGFQSHHENGGYLLVFRELHAEASEDVKVPLLSGTTIELAELSLGSTSTETFNNAIPASGKVPLPSALKPGGWALLRYSLSV